MTNVRALRRPLAITALILMLAIAAPDPLSAQSQGYGTHTIRLYNPATGIFYLRNSNTAGAADATFQFGPGGLNWTPLAGDWNGDGADTVGLYAPGAGIFFLRNSNTAGAADTAFVYGPAGAGWIPLVGDWNGNGVGTVGLYNPAASTFFLRNSNTSGAADVAFGYGPAGAGWIPLVGDWNGDGVDTVGLYNPATGFFFLRNSNTAGAADVTFQFGPGGLNLTPLTGDWNRDGTDTVGLFAPGGSSFFLRNSNTSGAADVAFGYGPARAGWTASAGVWTGPSIEPSLLNYDIDEGVAVSEVDLIRAGFDLARTYFRDVLQGDLPPDMRGSMTVKLIATGLGNEGACCTALDANGFARPFFDVRHPHWNQAPVPFSMRDHKLKTSAHEFAHAWQHWLGCLGRRRPGDRWMTHEGWITEGAAEFVGYLSRIRLGELDVEVVQRFMLLSAINTGQVDVPLESLEYIDVPYVIWPGHIGYLALELLASRASTRALSIRNHCRDLGGGMTREQAFQNAFGVTKQAFYQEFPAYVAELRRKWGLRTR